MRVGRKVLIPEAALAVRFVRSSGPGGQNVNKVASKVELHVDLDRIQGLNHDSRRRLERAARRRDRLGRWLVTSQTSRDQHRNLTNALTKVRAAVEGCLVVPRQRKPTHPNAAARERRLREKQRRSEKKRSRSRLAEE